MDFKQFILGEEIDMEWKQHMLNGYNDIKNTPVIVNDEYIHKDGNFEAPIYEDLD